MKIACETISQHDHRDLGALGDYWYDTLGTLQIRATGLGNPLYEKLIFIHELIEETLTRHKGITEESIMAFDMAHQQSPEPGLEVDAPYRDEHLLAEAVERLILAQLGIPWKVYNEAVEVK